MTTEKPKVKRFSFSLLVFSFFMQFNKKIENRFIIHLLRENADKKNFTAFAEGEIDWNYIFQTADIHRVVPLLYKNLKSIYSHSIPAEALEKFQNRYNEIARHNFARTTQLIKLVEQFQKNNLSVIAYKGMALAEFAYNDVTLRQFTDIDLFVKKKDFFEVKKTLEINGCQPAWDLTTKQEKAVLNYYYEYPFFYGETGTLIEVHWEFLESFFAFDFDTKKLWENCETVNFYGKKIKTLSAEDYLLILCVHGSKHLWRRLSWICDVAFLIKNSGVNWKTVEERATKTGSLRMIRLGLYLAKEILKINLPNEINERILNDKTAVFLGEKFKNDLFKSQNKRLKWSEAAKLHLQMREKPSTKLNYSYRLLTTKLIDKFFMPMGRPR